MLYDGIRLTEGSAVTNLVLPRGLSFPNNPDPGELFFRQDLQRMFVYQNGGWVDITAVSNNTQVLKANFTGPVSPTVGTVRYYMPQNFKILNVYASIGSPSGVPVVYDVKVNGTSLFPGTKPSIASGQFLGSTAVLGNTYNQGTYITADIISGGGSNLLIHITYQLI